MNREEALRQNPAFPCPPEILERQILVEVDFYDFNSEKSEGVIVVDRDLAADVRELFEMIFRDAFPITSAIPIAMPLFDWSDDRSMAENNTSGFNYRPKTGQSAATGASALSAHALGRAIDINPRINPYIKGDIILPPGAIYDANIPGTITPDSFIVKFLKSRGWVWGGEWTSLKDYQHFEKL